MLTGGSLRPLVLIAFLLTASPAARSDPTADFFGQVLVTSAGGAVRPMSGLPASDFRVISIVGPGGAFWPVDSGFVRFESADRRGARLVANQEREWILEEGSLEMSGGDTINIRCGRLRVTGRGHVMIEQLSEHESHVGVYEGSVTIRSADMNRALNPYDAVRATEDGKITRERLLPPPHIAALPLYTSTPMRIDSEIDNENIFAGAVSVEWSQREHFWESAERKLFRPHEPIILTDLPDGRIFIRCRSVNRSASPGPSRADSTWILNRGARPVTLPELIFVPFRGELAPPLPDVAVRWNGVRTRTDSEGHFELSEAQFGLYLSDIEIDAGPFAPRTHSRAAALSDPDRVARILPQPENPGRLALFTRMPFIPLFRADGAAVTLDGLPVEERDTHVEAPLYTHRHLRMDAGGERPLELTIVRDTEGPRILRVELETRESAANQFYVVADILDLGIGLQLPVQAVFESDAGEHLEFPLLQVDRIRLEARVSAEAARPGRSRVWWIRVEARDLLGNSSLFEKTLFRKHEKKFLSVGLKDLVHIWKNKL